MPRPTALFVTTVASTLEAFLLPLAAALRERGWEVDALSSGATQLKAVEAHFDHRFEATWSRSLSDPGNFIGAPGTVRRLAAERKYDIVHVHTPIASFVTRFALRKHPRDARPQVIYTAHGFHFFEGGSPLVNTAFRAAERLAAKWTDFLVTMNTEDYRAAQGFGTIPPDRVRHIPGVGVDPDSYRTDAADGERVRAALDVGSTTFVITMIAEMNANKRHSFVLDALGKMHHRDSVLLLVGEGPQSSELRKKVEELGLGRRVRFLGQRTDVPAVLAATDALVMASLREGLPRVVLEAMSAGVPVVGTRTRGVTDAVDETAGWLVDRDDPSALASALDHAATHPTEALDRGRAGYHRVLECFSQPAITAAYLELYDEALSQIHR